MRRDTHDPGLGVYRVLLRLYPRSFRERYGPDLVAFVREARRGTTPELSARARFWLGVVTDLIASAVRLRLSPDRDAQRTRAWRRATGERDMGVRVPTPPEEPRTPLGGRDLGLALRSLSRSPGYLASILVSLGLGIGTATAIFSVLDHVVLRPLPYPDPDRLVVVGARFAGVPRGLSAPNTADLAARATTLDGFGVSRIQTLDVTGEGEATRFTAAAVSPSFLETLGARTELGRTLRPEDDRPGMARVAVMSHAAWVGRWGADPRVVGRTITANRAPLTIVGVMAASFRGPEALGQGGVDFWLPVAFVERGADPLANRADQFLSVLARLRPGATLESARSEVDAIGRGLVAEFPADNAPRGRQISLGLESLHEATVRAVRPRLGLLLAAVGLLFVAGLSSAIYLMIARMVERRREMAVRRALGAGVGRIARLCASESILASLLGGALGVAIAAAEVRAFLAFQPPGLPRTADIRLDLRVLAFALAVSLLSGMVISLVTGARGMRVDPVDALRGGGRTSSHGRGEGALRSTLLAAQTAVALVLLFSGGLLMRSFLHVVNVPLGYETEGVTTMEVFVGGWYATSAERIGIYRDVMREIGALPGVTAAGVTTDLPLPSATKGAPIYAGENADPDRPPDAIAGFHYVSPGYFQALSMSVLPGGRGFTDRDVDQGRRVAIVSERLAELLFGDREAVGRHLSLAGMNGSQPPFEIVGVASDVRQQTLEDDETQDLYVPHTGGFIGPPLNVVVRSSLEPAQIVPALRAAVRRVDPDLPIGTVATLRERVARAMALPRFFAVVFGMFATAAAAIAAAGIYGSMAYAAARRRREIGVRVALGARPAQVTGLLLRRTVILTGTGILAGLALVVPMIGLLGGFLIDVEPFDPLTLVGGATVLGALQVIAGLGPALRSARQPILDTLRE